MYALLNDLRYAFRKLIARPNFAAVIVLTLALSIGANTAIFSVVDAVLLRPLPYRDADRLVKIFEAAPAKQQSKLFVSLGDFNEWKTQSQSFEDMVAFANVSSRVAGPTLEEVTGARVSANFFEFLGVNTALGRGFIAEDANPTSTQVAILSHSYWVSHFGADQSIINRTLVLNNKPHLIVGVLPANFYQTFGSVPGQAKIWTPAAAKNEDGTATGPGGYSVIARLKPDVTISQARAEMLAIADRLAKSYPETNTGVIATVNSLHEEVTNSSRRSLVVLFVAVGFVLLIACANTANLLLTRSIERSKEVAIRLAIGAGRRHVIRELLLESLLLSLFGGLLGWFVATWILRAIIPLMPPTLPRVDEITLDYRSLVFTLAISLLTTLLFGLSPAFHAANVSLTESLKNLGRTSSPSFRSRKLRQTLIVVQVGLTTVLLAGAGLLTNSLIRLYRVEPGFDTRNLVSMHVRLPRTNKEVPQQWNVAWNSLLESARQVPGTTGAVLATPLPLDESRYTMKIGFVSPNAFTQEAVVGYTTISQNYFQLLGVRLLQGREFTLADDSNSPPVVVVNETFARVYFSNQQVVGKTLALDPFDDKKISATIVGVVADSRSRLDEEPQPHFYQVASQFPPPSMYLLARTTASGVSYFNAVRSASLNPSQTFSSLTKMEHLWNEYTVRPRFYLSLLGGLALLGLTLASVGIYGLLSHNVSQLTHEIGIRRALGARDTHLLRIVIFQGMALALIGVVGGLVCAAFMTRLIQDWLFEVRTNDPSTFAIVGVVLLVAALVACYFPARRATKVDPLVALRYE